MRTKMILKHIFIRIFNVPLFGAKLNNKRFALVRKSHQRYPKISNAGVSQINITARIKQKVMLVWLIGMVDACFVCITNKTGYYAQIFS